MITPLKHSGMARVLEGSHSFTCTLIEANALITMPDHHCNISLLECQWFGVDQISPHSCCMLLYSQASINLIKTKFLLYILHKIHNNSPSKTQRTPALNACFSWRVALRVKSCWQRSCTLQTLSTARTTVNTSSTQQIQLNTDCDS